MARPVSLLRNYILPLGALLLLLIKATEIPTQETPVKVVATLFGFVADHSGLRMALLLPVVCYVYIMWYGLRGSRRVEALEGTPLSDVLEGPHMGARAARLPVDRAAEIMLTGRDVRAVAVLGIVLGIAMGIAGTDVAGHVRRMALLAQQRWCLGEEGAAQRSVRRVAKRAVLGHRCNRWKGGRPARRCGA